MTDDKRKAERRFNQRTMKIRGGIAARIACVATLALILAATPQPAARAQYARNCEDFLPDTKTVGEVGLGLCNPATPLINIGSGKCFAPNPPDSDNGELIQQRTCDADKKQQFYWLVQVGYMDDGCGPWWFPCWNCICAPSNMAYFIMNELTQKCVDARDGAKDDWSVVQQWGCRLIAANGTYVPDKTARSMIWTIVDGDLPLSGPGWRSFKLKNFNSGLCLDVRSGSSDEYVQLQQYHCTSNNSAQNFTQGDTDGNWVQAIWPK
jgi:hypothetical protein